MSAYVPTFEHPIIEKKWQDRWYGGDAFKAVDFDPRPKWYSLVEFPYPSGAGMHVGHIRAFASQEVIARKRRMEGYNVLFPIGFDAFGLPTENYAIANHVHPRAVTDRNIATFTAQLKATGFSFDFSRVVDTTDPAYYRWTQWIFLQLFKHGLVYKAKTYVNFCPSCRVVLSNEESQGGECDRCGSAVVQREKDVWFLRITKYADKLIRGLAEFEASARIKTEEEKWIGPSEGAFLDFAIAGSGEKVRVFTTRPDTVYGATFLVLAPEHPVVAAVLPRVANVEAVRTYQEGAKRKSEFERVELNKEKTGIRLEGVAAVNPATGREIPVFIADYVMITYGTGAIMAVPGHDERDHAFARKFGLPIVEVIAGGNVDEAAYTDVETGVLVNSGILDGLSVAAAKDRIIRHFEARGIGEAAIQYRMKDWAFNRQRYWGEPIPLVHCDRCGVVPVPEAELPVRLPMVERFEPTDTGESPLANIPSFVECRCPRCGGPARRETDTMPQWAGSSWYFLRYMDPANPIAFADPAKLAYWDRVDWYNGGMEHVTRHLIYSRFWNLFLHDIGKVPNAEPYRKRTAQGLILGADGEKMSKSRGNVVNPMDIIAEYGADTLRTYLLFISDYELPTPWSDSGVKGCRRFLDRLWRLQEKVVAGETYSAGLDTLMHRTVKGVGDDVEAMKFNTAIAKMMILANAAAAQAEITRKDLETMLLLVYPFAPHLASEIWEQQAFAGDPGRHPWPGFDPAKLADAEVEIVVNVNGRVRDRFLIAADASEEALRAAALALPKIVELIGGQPVRKVVVVPKKLVNIVL